ncbi:ROK family protein [Oscillospiraceae bacterium 50-60]
MIYLGIAIGGTKCITALGRETEGNMEILGTKLLPTAEGGSPYGTLENLARLGDELLAEHGITKPNAIGIACGSPLDNVRGIIQSPANLIGWDDIPAVEIMERHFDVPAFLENDANGGALAEWRFGAAKGYSHAVFITFGTGCGCGLILNGGLYTGACGMAGEVGHVRLTRYGPVGCGRQGSVEGFCSGGGIRQLAQQMVYEELQQGKHPAFCPTPEALAELTAKSVAEAALSGDPLANAIYRASGEKLGEALSILIDIINPEVVVIGSIFARAEALLRPSMEKAIAENAIRSSASRCKIIPAALGDQIDIYEALAIASYAMSSKRI